MMKIDEVGLERLIKSYKPLKHSNRKRIQKDISQAYGFMDIYNRTSNKTGYNFHKVPVNGVEYLVADAKYLNDFTHQTGRGNLRYLFDLKTKNLVGIDYEEDSGSYRKVA